MKPVTDKQQQWIWFILLWLGGLTAVFLIATLIRWMIRL